MKTSELDYALPPELIAQEPLKTRHAARMMIVDRGRGHTDSLVRSLAEALPPSLFVVNDTRVLRARLHGRKASGGKVEVLLVEPADARTWWVLTRSSKPLRAGAEVSFGDWGARIEEKGEGGRHRVEFSLEGEAFERALQTHGELPLPPYIQRPPNAEDDERYQTVFAEHPGAIAAPTAGLHFDDVLLEELHRAGHTRTSVTLHVGPGTFRPVRVDELDEHPMHEERFVVSDEAATAIAEARREGRPVVAVGTTSVRVLESAADTEGRVQAGSGRTSLFVQPGYRAKVVDHLLTNFHLPRSTLLALVMAFGEVETVRAAYAQAVELEYRFFSYGDAMLIRGIRG